MTADPTRWLWAAVTVGLWLILTLVIAWRARKNTKAIMTSGETLIAVASQTGFGDELAAMTCDALVAADRPARVVSFADLTPEDLQVAERILFVASTTGEGDPPDSAARFVRKIMGEAADLSSLTYGLLALGDHTYKDFCGFGRALDDWLTTCRARPLFQAIEVDNGDPDAIARWREELGRLTGSQAIVEWSLPDATPWRLAERRLLNPGSPGEGAWLVGFEPIDGALDWVAGDIAVFELATPESEAAHREYSVASLPADGRAEFVIRLMRGPDGAPGLGSGRLTQTLAVGDTILMRIRPNRAFHGPAADAPMILIGNGTGIAGLRAHLKQRRAEGASAPNWLMFGERTARHDSLFDAELQAMLADGSLVRLDRVFSRDAGDGRYVQAVIVEAADEVRAWINRGAVLYVCGSLEGMAGGVHTALEQVLGAEVVRDLTETGRYRQDVY